VNCKLSAVARLSITGGNADVKMSSLY